MPSEPGWYRDPQGRHELRYHDGSGWTAHVSNDGVTAEDPVVDMPGPAGVAPPGSVDQPGEPRRGPTPEDTPPVRSWRPWWLVGGLAAVIVAVVVAVVLVAGGGEDEPAEPLAGTFEGGGDQVDISLVVAGEPRALRELSIDAGCERVSSSQTIEFTTGRPIEDGHFEVFLPPPGGLELDGTFVDGGRRVEGHVVVGGCDEDWAADLVENGDAPDEPVTGDEVPADDAVDRTTPDDAGDDSSEPTVPDDDSSAPTVPDDDSSAPTVPDGSGDGDGDGAVPVDEAVFRDDFDGPFAAGWQWLNEDPGRWSVDTREGWLSIEAQDVTPEGIANIFVRSIDLDDDVTAVLVTTLVAFEPTSNFQFAGLVVAGPDPDADRAQFGRAYCDGQACVGDGLYFDRVEQGALVGDNFAIPFEGPSELYIQLVVISEGAPGFEDAGGTTVFAAYSFDGDEWLSAGDHTVGFEVEFVGLVAHQAPTEITAAFDFFEVETFTG